MNSKLAINSVAHPQVEAIPAPLEVHPSVSPLAAELLMKTAEVLHMKPELYNQQYPTHRCNSPCCIVGHMEAFAGESDMCGKAVGLTYEQYRGIFNYPSGWPAHLVKFEMRACEVPASMGIARIEHMLTHGV